MAGQWECNSPGMGWHKPPRKHVWRGCIRPISTRSVLSRRKYNMQHHSSMQPHHSELCPLLWCAANLTCPSCLVTAEHFRKSSEARISPSPTTISRIQGSGQLRHRENALAQAFSRQSLLKNPICPTPHLCIHVCVYTHTHIHVHKCLHGVRRVVWDGQYFWIFRARTRGSWFQGYAEFTRPWSIDTSHK